MILAWELRERLFPLGSSRFAVIQWELKLFFVFPHH